MKEAAFGRLHKKEAGRLRRPAPFSWILLFPFENHIQMQTVWFCMSISLLGYVKGTLNVRKSKHCAPDL